jgi:hypothetical protein
MNRQPNLNNSDFIHGTPTKPGILSNYFADHNTLCYALKETLTLIEDKVYQFTGGPEAVGESGKTGPIDPIPLLGTLAESLHTLRGIGNRLEAVKSKLDLL